MCERLLYEDLAPFGSWAGFAINFTAWLGVTMKLTRPGDSACRNSLPVRIWYTNTKAVTSSGSALHLVGETNTTMTKVWSPAYIDRAPKSQQ